MKNIRVKILALLMILTAGACQDYLDVVPDNIATIDDAFVDRASTERFLATCYNYLPQMGNPDKNPGFLAGDEVWICQEQVDDSYSGKLNSALIARGLQSVTNPNLNYWDGGNHGHNLWIGIRDCNIFLENVNEAHDLLEHEKKQWIAEVKFLKAYYHFWLLKLYGPIPIVDENFAIDADIDLVKVHREPFDDVVEYIVELIEEATPDLPVFLGSLGKEYGRITQPIALAIKARILTTAASPLYNGNPDFASLIDNRGIALFNNTYDPTKWEKAAKALKIAIDTAHSVNHSLFNNYISQTEISDVIRQESILRSIITERESPEVIWPATNSKFTKYWQRFCVPCMVAAQETNPVTQAYAPTLRMAELFYTKNGVPIEEDGSFDYENRYTLRTAVTEENDYVRAGEKTASLHFDRESRFYASIAFDRGTYFMDPVFHFMQNRKGELASKREVGQWTATGYLVKKLISPKTTLATDQITPHYEYPWPIIRLGDLYLLYAEVLNEIKGAPDQEVYEYVDLIRARAGLAGVVESWSQYSNIPDKPTTKVGMREIIKQERLIELAFEGQRFWDLRRWKDAKKYMNQPIRGWNVFGDINSYYNLRTVYLPTFTFKDYLWPLKEEEIVRNPNLEQNPGW
jgi:hypothetical protein